MAKGKSKPDKDSRPKAKGPSKPARGKKGRTMFKLMFLAAIIGIGYAAWTVRYHGETMVQRGVQYVEHNVHFQSPVQWGDGDAKPAPKKGHDAVADRRHAPAPAEQISQSDKDALNHLIP